MSGYGPVIIRIVNFIILAFILFRVLGKATSQFLYARRMRIRRRMLDAIVSLKKARSKASASKALYESLPKDIAARRGAISARAQKECEMIRREAVFKAEHMVDGARRLAEEERAKAENLVKARLLGSAFDRARSKLQEMSEGAGGVKFAERAVEELASVADGMGASQRA